MNTSRMKWSSLLLAMGKADGDRRPSVASRGLGCESLEGRQLLSGGMQGLGRDFAMGGRGMANTADVAGGWQNSGSNGGSATGSGMSTHASRFDALGGGSGGMGGGGDFGGAGGDFGGAGGGFGGGGMMIPGLSGDAGLPGVRMDRGGASGGSAGDTQLQTDLTKLRTDSQAIHDKSVVTPVMEAAVRNDIKAIKGAETTTADPTATATLQADQKAAAANTGGPTDAQIAQVQADQDAVYKSQGVNAALITQLDTDRQTIVTASNVTSTDEATLSTDRTAVQADLAKLKASQPAPTTPAPGTTSTAPGSTDSSTSPTSTSTTDSSSTAQPPAAATAVVNDSAATPSSTTSTTATPAATTSTTSTTPVATPTPVTTPSVPGAGVHGMHRARGGFAGHQASFRGHRG